MTGRPGVQQIRDGQRSATKVTWAASAGDFRVNCIRVANRLPSWLSQDRPRRPTTPRSGDGRRSTRARSRPRPRADGPPHWSSRCGRAAGSARRASAPTRLRNRSRRCRRNGRSSRCDDHQREGEGGRSPGDGPGLDRRRIHRPHALGRWIEPHQFDDAQIVEAGHDRSDQTGGTDHPVAGFTAAAPKT